MGVQMPASLLEIGFVTNPEEEKGLKRKKRRDEIARAISRAIGAFAARYDERRGVQAKHSLAR